MKFVSSLKKNYSKVNTHPRGANSPNLVTLRQAKTSVINFDLTTCQMGDHQGDQIGRSFDCLLWIEFFRLQK
jgi:hypothetical protein